MDKWEWSKDGMWLQNQDGELVLYYTIDDNGIHGKVEDKALIAAAPHLLKALQAILSEETVNVHVGYDNSPGGGNFLYAEAVRTDSDAFTLARAALKKFEGRS